MQVSSTEAIEQTTASTSIRQLPKVYVFDLNAEPRLLATVWLTQALSMEAVERTTVSTLIN